MYKFDVERTYSFIKGYCIGLRYHNAVKSLAFARDMHCTQYRKNGEPYIIHPMTIAGHAIALGIGSDEIIATAMLHDVLEDCGVTSSELPVSSEIIEAVKLLTYVKPSDNSEAAKLAAQEQYYKAISKNRIASIVKILDRCHNVSTMAGTFTVEKVEEYIDETNRFVIPLIRSTKDQWPEMSEELFILKYHIYAVIDSLQVMLKLITDKEHGNN